MPTIGEGIACGCCGGGCWSAAQHAFCGRLVLGILDDGYGWGSPKMERSERGLEGANDSERLGYIHIPKLELELQSEYIRVSQPHDR